MGEASELCPRRFRFASKKEAAGVAVAVILVGTMEIESRSWLGGEMLEGVFFAGDDGER